MPAPAPARRRPWLMALPLFVVLALAAGWSLFWVYAAGQVEAVIAGWREREAAAGRHYACGEQTVSGFPFRFELRCGTPRIELTGQQLPLTLQAARAHIVGQVYDPTLLIAEVSGPLTASAAETPPLRAQWRLVQMSLRGRPAAPQRLSLVADALAVEQLGGAVPVPILTANRMEVHGRIAAGSPQDRPAIELAVTLEGARAAAVRPLAEQPLDFSAVALLVGLDNLRPLPLPQRLRQLQAAGGRLEVAHARLQHGATTATAAGELRLAADGHIEGTLRMTVAGLEGILTALGLDRVAPALGSARMGLALTTGLSLLGRPAELDGRKAVELPLRFAGGAVYLGPLRVGETRPVF